MAPRCARRWAPAWVQPSTTPAPGTCRDRHPARAITLADPGAPAPIGHNAINGTVAEVVYHGATTQVHVDVGAPAALIVDVPNQFGPQSVGYTPGMAVSCVCTSDAVRVLTRSAATLVIDPAAELVADPVRR